MKVIVQRTFTGSAYISVIIVSLLLHPIAFAIITALLNLASLLEVKKIGDTFFGKVYKEWVILNSILFLIFGVGLAMGLNPLITFSPLILLFIIQLVIPLYKAEENALGNIFLPFFGTAYISFPLILLNLIHQHSANTAIPFCLAIFIIIWTIDTFAYLSGMAFGKHRLFERISPKKSWEGFIGGTIMGVIATLVFYYFFQSFGLAKWIILSLLVSSSGTLGDLFESLLKRKAGIKDSGNILPGHGGILDRIDSILLVSPVVYLYIVFF